MNPTQFLDLIRIDLNLIRFENELKFYADQDPEPLSEERIQTMHKIIESFKKEREEYNKKTGKEKYFEEIDKYLYKKPWNRLSNFHKTIKMKEFIQSDYPVAWQDRLMTDLTQLIEEGKMGSKKQVDYDPLTESIKNIFVIKKNSKDDSFSIHI